MACLHPRIKHNLGAITTKGIRVEVVQTAHDDRFAYSKGSTESGLDYFSMMVEPSNVDDSGDRHGPSKLISDIIYL